MGDYLHTIGEMSGLGTSAICSIVSEVCAKPLLIVFGTVMGSCFLGSTSSLCSSVVCKYSLGYLVFVKFLYCIKKEKEGLVDCLWEEQVSKHMPTCETEFLGEVHDMQELWQFPCAWAAVNGCHIPIKCPNKTKTQNENTKRKHKAKIQNENTK